MTDCKYLLRRGMSVLCIDSTDPSRNDCDHCIDIKCFDSRPATAPETCKKYWNYRADSGHLYHLLYDLLGVMPTPETLGDALMQVRDRDIATRKAEREKVRPEVWQFALLMEKKLKENDHKSHWSKCNQEYLLKRLDEEVEELHKCFFFYSPGDMNFFMDGHHEDKIPGEAVDVANFAMMLWDNFGEKESLRGEP